MATATANQALAKVVQLEKDVDAKIHEAKVESVTIQKRDWLELQCKQFENNIKISGLEYNIKDYHRMNASARKEWRSDIIARAFVDTNVLSEDLLFTKNANGSKALRRIVRDAHPLGRTNNSTIIVAFTESWIANDVKERVRKGEGLEMTKTRRGKEPEVVKIYSHLPTIIDCLRNEALRARKDLKAKSGGKKYVCNESFKQPWISLYEIVGERKIPVPFPVEDRRLIDPARTLAIYAVGKVKEFKPFRLLPQDEKDGITASIADNIVHPVVNPTARDVQMSVG